MPKTQHDTPQDILKNPMTGLRTQANVKSGTITIFDEYDCKITVTWEVDDSDVKCTLAVSALGAAVLSDNFTLEVGGHWSYDKEIDDVVSLQLSAELSRSLAFSYQYQVGVDIPIEGWKYWSGHHTVQL